MDYNSAIDYLIEISGLGSKLELTRIEDLLSRLGNPHEGLKVIHVAGTNGKGSTSTMMSQILIEAGYKTALYTSPHLESYNERYKIDNIEITDNDFAKYMDKIKFHADIMDKEEIGRPTLFEQLTALGFKYFYDNNVDYAVIEVGLGGRFDATNALKKPIISMITSIGFDHTEYLGNTLGEIAFEKAGIIKNKIPTILYRQSNEVYSVIKSICDERDSKLYYIDEETEIIKKQDVHGTIFSVKNDLYEFEDIFLPLVGGYQIKNCELVLLGAYALQENGVKLTKENILKGIKNACWHGRMEVLRHNPLIIVDGAHNPDGIDMLIASLKQYFENKRIVVLMGVLQDKNYDSMAKNIMSLADVAILTEPDSDRALDVQEFKKTVVKYNENVVCFKNIEDALTEALRVTSEDDVLVCVGSLYLIGKVRKIIMGGNHSV